MPAPKPICHIAHPNNRLSSGSIGSWSTDEYWRQHDHTPAFSKESAKRLTKLPPHKKNGLQYSLPIGYTKPFQVGIPRKPIGNSALACRTHLRAAGAQLMMDERYRRHTK